MNLEVPPMNDNDRGAITIRIILQMPLPNSIFPHIVITRVGHYDKHCPLQTNTRYRL